MFVFNEGVPRAGKSYDAVKTHLLPALEARRKVVARLNGLNRPLIANRVGLSMDELDRLLIEVPTAEVKQTFRAERDASGQWVIPAHLKDALFIIDEAHEFYVASREPIDPSIEQFFALASQNGMDGVLMSQWYRRLHSSLRARIERKNCFQKMTAVGMDGKYTLKQYHATEPDRFELVDTVVKTYDPEIFPLYHGYAPGSANTDVYKAGGTTVWRKLGKYGIVMAVIVALGAFALFHFLHHPQGMIAKTPHRGPLATMSAVPVKSVSSASSSVSSGGLQHAYDEKGMTPEVKYVFDLCAQARPRLAAVLTMGRALPQGVIEWPQDQGAVLDRMTFDQLRDLGIVLEVRRYGVKLHWGSQVVIVTSWPLPPQTSDQTATSTSLASSSPQLAANAPSSVPSAEQGGGASWHTSSMRSDYYPPELTPKMDAVKSGTGM